MSLTFTKLFSSITESTIWDAPDTHRILWITMLAMADRRGRIYSSIPGLANRARVKVPDVEAALLSFMSPDPYSRTKDHEGRRIEEFDGGWRLINYEKYRGIISEESVLESKRKYINAKRAEQRGKVNVEKCRTNQPNVDSVDKSRHLSIQAEAEAYIPPPNPPKGGKCVDVSKQLPSWLPTDDWLAFVDHRKKLRVPMTDVAKGRMIARLEQLRADGHDPAKVLDQSILNGWRGVFPLRAEQHVKMAAGLEPRPPRPPPPQRPESKPRMAPELASQKMAELRKAVGL